MQMVGKCLLLRDEPQEKDYKDLFRWRNLEEWNYYDEPDRPFKPVTLDEYESWRRHPQPMPSGARHWEIDTLEGKHIGWVGYYQLDKQTSCAYVGIALPEPETWGHGFGPEAIRLVVDYLFREMGLQSVKIKTWNGNRRMRRVAEKVGFKELGRSPHRAPVSIRGEPLEFIEYALSNRSKSL